MVAQDPTLGNGLYYSPDGKAYVIGIIDPLTQFTGKKKAEYIAKRVTKGDGSSCVPADLYAARFSKSMKEYIKLTEEEESPNFRNSARMSKVLDSFLP